MIFNIEIDFLKDYLIAKDNIRKTIFTSSENNYEMINRFNKAFFSRKVKYQNLPNIRPEELKEYLLRKTDLEMTSLISQVKSDDNTISPFSYQFVENSVDTKSLRKETNHLVYKLNDVLNDTINEKLFVNTEFNIKEDLKTWNRLSEKIIPFEFLVISDSFLFLNNAEAISDMLNVLIPRLKGLKKTIVINTAKDSFSISKGIGRSEQDVLLKQGIKHKYDDLKMKFPDINLLLTVNKYHKRLFFTNCQYFDSDNSFSYYFMPNEKLKCFSPLGYDDGKKQLSFYSNLSYIKEVLNKASQTKFFMGDKNIAANIIAQFSAME